MELTLTANRTAVGLDQRSAYHVPVLVAERWCDTVTAKHDSDHRQPSFSSDVITSVAGL